MSVYRVVVYALARYQCLCVRRGSPSATFRFGGIFPKIGFVFKNVGCCPGPVAGPPMSMMWLARKFCKWFLPSWQEGQRGPEWSCIMLRGTALLKQTKCVGTATHNLNVLGPRGRHVAIPSRPVKSAWFTEPAMQDSSSARY